MSIHIFRSEHRFALIISRHSIKTIDENDTIPIKTPSAYKTTAQSFEFISFMIKLYTTVLRKPITKPVMRVLRVIVTHRCYNEIIRIFIGK